VSAVSPGVPNAPTVVIVGAGPGLSQAIARRFVTSDASIALIARSPDRLAGLVAELRDLGARADGFPADASDPDSLRAALGAAAAERGDPDVLVYTVSPTVLGAPTEVSYDDLLGAFRTGVGGALVAAQAVVPAMRRAASGTILLAGSGVALRPWVGAAATSVQKAGLRNLALALAAELRPDGIHVAIVTIMGVLKQGTAFDPDVVADAFLRVHQSPPDEWQPEVTFRG
jgi:NAD(P)-dependent dehydrogenase (short-subunit alcohol dehydrogenase family)